MPLFPFLLGGTVYQWTPYGYIERDIDATSLDTTVFALEAHLKSTGGGEVAARLYNITDSAEVLGMRVTTTSTSVVRVRGDSIALSGDKEYRIDIGTSEGEEVTAYDAVLIMLEAP